MPISPRRFMMVASALDPLTGVANRGKMRPAKKLLVAACLSIALLMAAKGAAAQGSPLRDQIIERENKLAQAREGKNTREVSRELFFLGTLYRLSGKMQKALECLNEALPIEQSAGDQVAQAVTLNAMGRVYTDLGQEDKALALFSQSLPIVARAGA